MIIDLSAVKFLQARHYSKANRQRGDIRLIVLHSAETAETFNAAESVLAYFHTTERIASANYIVDKDSVCKAVNEHDIAYGAPHVNAYAVHIEHAGYARQTREQWLDDYGQLMLPISAKVCAQLCVVYGIPPVFLAPHQLRVHEAGITSHENCSKAFGGTHTDPGPGFPWDWYLHMVRAEIQEDAQRGHQI